jgi:hypothetical protein
MASVWRMVHDHIDERLPYSFEDIGEQTSRILLARCKSTAFGLTRTPKIDGSIPSVKYSCSGSYRKIWQLQVERDFLAGLPAISRVLRGGR